jgi:hypothetical protein
VLLIYMNAGLGFEMSYFPLMDFKERSDQVRTLIADDEKRAIYDRTIAAIDPALIRKLQEKYQNQLADFDPIGIFKYADFPFWIERNVALAQRLKLERLPSFRLLDIGMGAGHFAAVAHALGHEVVGTDISVPLYDDFAEALQLDRRIVPVVRGESYPDLGGKFDRIIIVWQVFDQLREHSDGTRDYWSADDWAFFLGDLAARHARSGAVLHLELNPHIQKGEGIFDQPLLDYCAARGGDMALADNGIVDIPAVRLLV